MTDQKKRINLGFTNQEFTHGVHVCQIFNSDEERHDALVHFILSGIESGENTACFTEKENEATLEDFFKEHGMLYQEKRNSGEFSFQKSGEVYFEGGSFEPDKMIELLEKFYQKSKSQNRSGARVIGEMVSTVDSIPGGTRLMEYEAKVSMLVKTYPISAVCQYDAREFDGATLLEVLKVHPYMIVHGSIVHNPFFIQPEEYLSKSR